jgi:hypothetical protein
MPYALPIDQSLMKVTSYISGHFVHRLMFLYATPAIVKKCMLVRLSPERMGPLGKPPALPTATSRTSSRTGSHPSTPTAVYTIRVWSYATFIVIEAVINSYIAIKT